MMRIPKCLVAFQRINTTITPRYVRHLSSLPSHEVVGMPALSPTMESGTIAKWTCKVGQKISPGDSLAEVETDKATMSFEAQDEFYIAKLLVEAGAEVKVGDPILVSVEDESFIAAFANFTAPNARPAAPAPAAAAAPPTPAPTKPTVVETPPAPKPQPVAASIPAAQAAMPVTKAAPPQAAVSAAPKKAATSTTDNFVFGSGVLKGALVNKLAAEQKEYIQKYGRAGNLPLKVGK